MKNSLELGLIGNCRIGALIDERGEIVWSCLPRFDGDPVFCSLLNEHPDGEGAGFCVVELLDQVEASQSYLPNTAVLVTRLTDSRGAVIEITDFSPRFHQYGRTKKFQLIKTAFARALFAGCIWTVMDEVFNN